MSLHTAQHLLSAVLETELQLPTLSWSLTTAPVPCYVELPRALTLEEIAAIQSKANALARAGRAVHVEVSEFERETYEDVPVVEVGNGKSRAAGKGVPQDYTGGVKRVIVIDGVDSNP
jgi:misacylated tRNA(Ala) deacylase